MSLRERKRSLRDAILQARDALDAAWREEASTAIAARIGEDALFVRAQTVLLTLPFRSEWNALRVVERALASGKIVAAPRVDAATRMLRAYRIEDPARDVETGYRGIPEPRATGAEIALASVDWVLVPGVAFDARGHRLGYGGGFYDRLLPIVPQTAARVAGAFEMQVVERVPTAPHDVAVDMIVTERRTLNCSA
ncbi:MAG TPA: 5-formyltetrahydrofolate cyclo-ligase [Casimicrobiaceae bacterium]|nr:5-formyltetrahydrofolate cyclo-ligase [Casimicrobiaceae bacterium]